MRPVVLLTDFGLADHYAGVLHAVLLRESPGVPRLDLSHGVPPGDLWTACFLLRAAWPHLPEDAVVLAVVDPGVGTGRRAVAVAVGGRYLVGPDNGLAAAVGEAAEVVVLEPGTMGLPEPSATFHGRDLFAPAAGRLARGEALASLGVPLDPAALVPCPIPVPERSGGTVRGVVQHVDRFGNVVTNIPAAGVPPRAELRVGWRRIRRTVRTYGEAPEGEVVILEGSSGFLEVSVVGGSAAGVLDLAPGDPVEVVVPPRVRGGGPPDTP